MPLAIWYMLGITGVLGAGGYFTDKTGEAAVDVSNSAVKLAVVGAIGFIILKKTKVL